jgi:hypothetical protein
MRERNAWFRQSCCTFRIASANRGTE